MTDRGPLNDPNETPEDVASLYSWANLHGAKYRDFSASRAQTREQARLRVEQAMQEEQARMQQQPPPAAENEAELQRMAEQARAEEDRRRADFAAQHVAQQAAERAAEAAAWQAAEQARQQAAEQAAEQAAQQAAAHRAAQQAAQQSAQQAAQQSALQATRQAAEHAAQEIARLAAKQAAQHAAQQAAELAAEKAAAEQAAQRVAQLAAERAQAAQRAAEEAEAAHRAAQQAAREATWQQPLTGSYSAGLAAEPAQTFVPPATPHYPPFDFPGYAASASQRPAQKQPQYPPMREADYPPTQTPWAGAESREPVGRPAWLNPDRPDVAAAPTRPSAPEDTLQGSRERLASRWYALRSLYDGPAPSEAIPAPVASRAPVVAIFSLAGGVGKTSVVATLGRALSARGERVLLVDTAPYGLLPFFFGACDQRPGLLRTFSPPGVSSDAPIQMITIDPEGLGPDSAGQETLVGEISTHARGVGRVIVDLATASGATTRRIMRMAPLVLVPMMPDMNSVVSVGSIDSFFQHNGGTSAKPSLPYYVLNQFDPSLPLHLDIREVLREQLGDRLLPFVIRRAPAVSEALAEGMTVMDYAPNSTVAEDFGSLAGWVKSQSAPASTTYRGVRWSER